MDKLKRAAPFAIIVVVLAVALLTAWYWRRSPGQASTPLASSHPVSAGNSVKLGADPAHVLGNTSAPVMLEEFGDFQCAACGSLHRVLKSMKSEFGPAVVIVFREFPIASHAHALAAARAAEAAGLQGKFWEMHDLLYENQKTWRTAADPQSLFAEYAAQTGLDPDSFRRDAAGDRVNQRIALDRERGYWVGVNSTPTVFLNGREVPPDSVTTEKLRDLVRSEIAANRRN